TMAAAFPPPHADNSEQRSVFMDIYAYLARFHMGHFGTTQRQLAMVSAKNHTHSSLNPDSQFQTPMTVEDVLAAREIIWPLTLPMCAPVSDGAAAAVVCNADGLARLKPQAPIRLLACVLGSGTDRKPEEFDRHLCRLAALKAYDQAGIGPQEIDVAEVHDATAFAEIQQTENLGFCAIGDGGSLVESGATSLSGSIPVNPSGGLQSKGHPIGATGLAQIHELVLQLRGRAGKRQVKGARFAIAENGGGFHGIEEAAACISILAA
ncbi:MAG: thiolase family protein, partial [Pseudomonadota bacterium]|nr:thiolase family protein [Pseudomonadota bacterium]